MMTRAHLAKVLRRMRLARFYLSVIVVVFLLSNAGCVSKTHFDTARTLPAGEVRFSYGVTGGYLHDPAYVYARQNPRFEDQPAPQLERYGDGPLFNPYLMVSRGFGDYFELFCRLEPLLAAQLGAKLAIVGDDDSTYAMAVRPRLAYAGGGFSLEWFWLLEGEVAVPNTVRIFPQWNLTLTPRIGLGRFTRTDPYGHDPSFGGEETMRAKALMWGANFGLAQYLESGGRTIFYEVSVTRYPALDLNETGGLEVTVGVGVGAAVSDED